MYDAHVATVTFEQRIQFNGTSGCRFFFAANELRAGRTQPAQLSGRYQIGDDQAIS